MKDFSYSTMSSHSSARFKLFILSVLGFIGALFGLYDLTQSIIVGKNEAIIASCIICLISFMVMTFVIVSLDKSERSMDLSNEYFLQMDELPTPIVNLSTIGTNMV